MTNQVIQTHVKTDFEAMKGVEGSFGQHAYLKVEDLPQNLRRYVWDGEGGMTWFHHPLYVTWFPTITPKPIEELLAMRQERADEALRRGDFAGYVFAHERGYRMAKLADLVWEGAFEEDGGFPRLSVKFWQIAAGVWVDAEHSEDDPCWTGLMDCGIPNRWAMTDSKDRRALRAMPEVVTVYRGVQATDATAAREFAHSGWSWTFSAKTARFFARRWLKPDVTPFVIRAQVPKDLIKAYLTGRGEDEALIRPGAAEACKVSVQRVSREHERRGR